MSSVYRFPGMEASSHHTYSPNLQTGLLLFCNYHSVFQYSVENIKIRKRCRSKLVTFEIYWIQGFSYASQWRSRVVTSSRGVGSKGASVALGVFPAVVQERSHNRLLTVVISGFMKRINGRVLC